MNRLRTAAAAALVFAGCATTSSSTTTATAETKPVLGTSEPTKLAITNVIPFDIAACGPRELNLTPLTNEVLTGALLSLSPAYQECFVDKKNRDGQQFDLKVKVTAAELGTTVEFSGNGATASGKQCVEAAIKRLTLKPTGAPIVAEVPVVAGPQTVSFGENAANDIAGKLRLGQLTQCVCYEKLGTVVPPALSADVDVSSDGKAKVSVGKDDEFSNCLAERFSALDLGKEPVKLKWPLLLKNSYATDVDPGATPALKFQQLDGIRAQRTADVIIAAGKRYASAVEYDAMAKDYKRKPAKGALDKLKAKCSEVIAGDDAQLAQVKSLIGVLENSQKLVQEEKKKDPAWEQVEASLAQQLTSSTGEVVRIEAQRKNDEGACPKTK